jgi:hypothetical protein
MKGENSMAPVSPDMYEMMQNVALKIERVDNKLEQIIDNIEKLEKNVENINTSLSTQERRITILEQVVPSTLKQDLMLAQTHIATMHKVIWVIGSAAVTAWLQVFFKLIIHN